MSQAEADEESDDEVRFALPKIGKLPKFGKIWAKDEALDESDEEGAEESQEEGAEESDEEGAEDMLMTPGTEKSHDEEQEAGHLLRQGHRFESPEAYEEFVRIPDLDALNNRTSSFDNVFNYLHGLGFLKDAPR